MISLDTTVEIGSRRRSRNSSSKRTYEERLSDVFSAFADEDALKLFETIAQHQNTNMRDFDTKKKYYSRLTKLKVNSLVKKKKDRYVLTAFGSSMYQALLHMKKTQYLYWQLQVIDALNGKLQGDQLKEMIESLIPEGEIRKILLTNGFASQT